jgi:putative NADH-flavin reductase
MSRYVANPTQSHWEHAKRVLRYLKGTAESRLVYIGGVSSAELKG